MVLLTSHTQVLWFIERSPTINCRDRVPYVALDAGQSSCFVVSMADPSSSEESSCEEEGDEAYPSLPDTVVEVTNVPPPPPPPGHYSLVTNVPLAPPTLSMKIRRMRVILTSSPCPLCNVNELNESLPTHVISERTNSNESWDTLFNSILNLNSSLYSHIL